MEPNQNSTPQTSNPLPEQDNPTPNQPLVVGGSTQPVTISPNNPAEQPTVAATEPDFSFADSNKEESTPETSTSTQIPGITPLPTVPETTETPDRPPVTTPSVISNALQDMNTADQASGAGAAQVFQPTQPASSTVIPNHSDSVVASSADVTSQNSTKNPWWKPTWTKKKLLFVVGSVVLVLALIGGVVFGLYLPNTPDNVWKTGINRTGTAVNSVVVSATEPKKLASYKTSEITGSVAVTAEGGVYAGDFTTKFDKTSLDGGLNFTLKSDSSPAEKLTAKVLSQIPSGSSYPDIYFQLTGLKTLNVDDLVPGASSYDGKWISVSSTYLKSVGDAYLSGTDNTQKQITSDDVAEVARATSSVTKNYVFSTDPTKAVFEKKSFVGKEKIDGMNTYHYKVGVNVANAKAYCTAISNAFLSTNAYKKVSSASSSDISVAKQTATKDCHDSFAKSIKSTDTFDLWIDKGYKLIYKIRIYDKTDKATYADIGQVYKGGDQLSLFATVHDNASKGDGKFTLDTNLKTNTTAGVFTYKGTDANSPFDVKVTVNAKSSNDTVKITKPTTSVPIEDVMKTLGVDTTGTTGAIGGNGTISSTDANDVERESDIASLQADLEEYAANHNGSYPTLGNINNASWRTANMPHLSDDALTDPTGKLLGLTTTASAVQYGYAPTGCTGNNCTGYTLTARLSDGTVLTRDSSF